MILLIDAGGMRSSAPLLSNTAPVSTSRISACFACVSIPLPDFEGGSAATVALGLGLTAAAVDETVSPTASKAPALRHAPARSQIRILIFPYPFFLNALSAVFQPWESR